MTTRLERAAISILDLLKATKQDLIEYAFYYHLTISTKSSKIYLLQKCLQRLFVLNDIEMDTLELISLMADVKKMLVASLDKLIEIDQIPCDFGANKKEKVFTILLWKITQHSSRREKEKNNQRGEGGSAREAAQQAAKELEKAAFRENIAFQEMMKAKAAYEKAKQKKQEAQRKAAEANRQYANSNDRKGQKKETKQQSHYTHSQQSSKNEQKQKVEQPESKYSNINFLALFRSVKHSLEKIKRLYREWALKTHPDQGGSPLDFIRVQKAYEWAKSYHN